MPKNSSYSRLWPFSRVIAHSFCVLVGFSRPIRPATCLRYMTKKLVVFPIYGCFHESAHNFMVLGRFTPNLRNNTCLRVMTKNSAFSCFMVIFMSYCPQFLGSSWICMPRKNPYMLERYDQKIVLFAFLWPFSLAIAHSF
jgi:hypothetical protein